MKGIWSTKKYRLVGHGTADGIKPRDFSMRYSHDKNSWYQYEYEARNTQSKIEEAFDRWLLEIKNFTGEAAVNPRLVIEMEVHVDSRWERTFRYKMAEVFR